MPLLFTSDLQPPPTLPPPPPPALPPPSSPISTTSSWLRTGGGRTEQRRPGLDRAARSRDWEKEPGGCSSDFVIYFIVVAALKTLSKKSCSQGRVGVIPKRILFFFFDMRQGTGLPRLVGPDGEGSG